MIAAGAIGNVLEEQVAQVLAAFGIFAVGFLMAVELPRQDPTDRSYSGWLVLGCALRLSGQIGTE